MNVKSWNNKSVKQLFESLTDLSLQTFYQLPI